MGTDTIELASLDADVRRAVERARSIDRTLAEGNPDALAILRARDPFAEVRHATTQSTYRALAASTPSILDVPWRDGLLRWVHELLQHRVGLELAVDDSEARHAVDPRLPARIGDARAKARAEGTAEGLTVGELATYDEALRAIVAAPDPTRAEAALLRAADLAVPVAAVRKERRERRFEAARRLGLASPLSLSKPAGAEANPAALARALLDVTEPLAVEILKAAKKKSEVPWRASTTIFLAVGHDAREGWPARPLARWLDDVWKPLVPRGLPLPPQPDPIGASSFLRAAVKWGFAWKTGGAPRSLPFALARDPYPVLAYRFGYALASAIGEPSFQRRSLELPSRVAEAQSRVLHTTMLLHSRLLAARVILGTAEHVDGGLFEEITARAFGAPLPSAMRDAWPDPRIDDAARLEALLTTRSFLDALVTRYDEDWFRNPKAGTHLTSLACAPAWDGESVPDAAPLALARFFEGALG